MCKGENNEKKVTCGIFIYEQVAELDFVGPMEVFTASHIISPESCSVVTIGKTTDPITGSGGLKVTPQYSFESAPDLDVLVLPGTGNVYEYAIKDSNTVEWVREQYDKVEYMTSVCTGALILQKAGLLKGRKATTHWMLADFLKNDPDITELLDMRYVRDGKIVTSAGVSAGIDMTLWLIGQIHTPDHSRQIQKILQYNPAPPYTSEV
ncbi:DJ-1/PfpI family protein [Maridesulfovibrio sp.]|uniref:DJ-1/PfpI family protein n=1 Tax=Maridesulfovibrio sp. TaxID=2795000 RepID=UPI002A18DB60|nr:DJ-1/PfpI family protein [Maridesulfovibrio sp.]